MVLAALGVGVGLMLSGGPGSAGTPAGEHASLPTTTAVNYCIEMHRE
jgi:hypothetical protein